MTESNGLFLKIRTFALSTFRLATALAIAFLFTSLVVAVGYWGWTSQSRAEAKRAETARTWTVDLPTLGLKADAKTKLVDGQMYVSLRFNGYPDYFNYPANQSEGFHIQFLDADGFNLFEKYLKVSEFATVVDGSGKQAGLMMQFTQFASVKDYSNLASMSVGWTLSTKAPKPARPLNPPASILNDQTANDHCAPGISRQERMSRLARHGQVREVGMGEYVAGGRTLHYIGGDLYSCK